MRMQRIPYTTTQTFRCTQELADALQVMARQRQRHSSEIIRAAVAYCLANPSCFETLEEGFR